MKLDMVGVITKDIDQAIVFYEALVFDVIQRFGEHYVELENDGVRISLNTQEMITGIYGFSPERVGHTIELAFLCDSPTDVDKTIRQMKEKGYDVFKEPWNAEWGQRYAIIKDVDGHLISLFAALQTSLAEGTNKGSEFMEPDKTWMNGGGFGFEGGQALTILYKVMKKRTLA